MLIEKKDIYAPYRDILSIISDTLIEDLDCQKMINLDRFKVEKKLNKFKSMDGIRILNSKIQIFEFKRCDLFYKERLSNEELLKVEEIIEYAPEKIIDTHLVLLPLLIEDYRKNEVYKSRIFIVLGDKREIDDPKSRGRERAARKGGNDYLERLRQKVSKYIGTSYIENIQIIDRQQFIKKYC